MQKQRNIKESPCKPTIFLVSAKHFVKVEKIIASIEVYRLPKLPKVAGISTLQKIINDVNESL